MSLTEGTIIDQLVQLERRLGDGGTGTVWKARHLASGEAVAVKLLDPKWHEHADVRARFLREGSIASRIVSEHVVRVMRVGHSSHGPYLVMDLVDGVDLQQHLASNGPLSLFETIRIVAQMCLALGVIHEAGVVHRDVKPENVVLSATRGALCAKLVDFGVARSVHETGSTHAGAILGTPAYMSPEQLLAARDVGPSADLWSLGAVAYTCLAGRSPFDRPTFGAICVAVSRGSVVPISAVRDDVPDALDDWFRRALATDARARFQTAEEMREALLDACSPLPLESPELDDRVRATRQASGERLAVRVATVVGPPPVAARAS